jgi:hypothetical protein
MKTFADFWFEDLEVAQYNLNIEAKGFNSKTRDAISTINDVHLGDIPLSE